MASHPLKFPNESQEYRRARDALLAREIELRRLTETVAAQRRALPRGGKLKEDYLFAHADGRGGAKNVKLSELFGPNPTLAIYSYMFGPEKKQPCVMCTPLLDGLDGVHEHVAQRVSLVAVAESPAERLAAWKAERGWKRLPVLSAAGTSYNRDYFGKWWKDASDTTMLNVFQKKGDDIFHFWGSEMTTAEADPGQDHRALDPWNPIFQMFDITPEGRGDWYTNLSYPPR